MLQNKQPNGKHSVNRTYIVRITVILGLATAEHHKMSSIKQGVCEGEVEYYF